MYKVKATIKSEELLVSTDRLNFYTTSFEKHEKNYILQEWLDGRTRAVAHAQSHVQHDCITFQRSPISSRYAEKFLCRCGNILEIPMVSKVF